MPGELVVRDAGPDDAEAIGTLLVAAWRAAYADLVPRSYLDGLDPAERAAWWRGHLEAPAPRVRIMVAVRDDDVVGFAGCGPPLLAGEPAGAGALYTLYVDPSCWGTGVGSALLAAVHETLDGDGWARAVLWVASGNLRARRFYEHHGWGAEPVTRTELLGGEPLEETRYRRGN